MTMPSRSRLSLLDEARCRAGPGRRRADLVAGEGHAADRRRSTCGAAAARSRRARDSCRSRRRRRAARRPVRRHSVITCPSAGRCGGRRRNDVAGGDAFAPIRRRRSTQPAASSIVSKVPRQLAAPAVDTRSGAPMPGGRSSQSARIARESLAPPFQSVACAAPASARRAPRRAPRRLTSAPQAASDGRRIRHALRRVHAR